MVCSCLPHYVTSPGFPELDQSFPRVTVVGISAEVIVNALLKAVL